MFVNITVQLSQGRNPIAVAEEGQCGILAQPGWAAARECDIDMITVSLCHFIEDSHNPAQMTGFFLLQDLTNDRECFIIKERT